MRSESLMWYVLKKVLWKEPRGASAVLLAMIAPFRNL